VDAGASPALVPEGTTEITFFILEQKQIKGKQKHVETTVSLSEERQRARACLLKYDLRLTQGELHPSHPDRQDCIRRVC